MLKFTLHCTCNLHLNVVKGFSRTILEDNLVQVRNKWLGVVDKDWEWFLSFSSSHITGGGGDPWSRPTCIYKVLLPDLSGNRNKPHL